MESRTSDRTAVPGVGLRVLCVLALKLHGRSVKALRQAIYQCRGNNLLATPHCRGTLSRRLSVSVQKRTCSTSAEWQGVGRFGTYRVGGPGVEPALAAAGELG